MTIELGLLAHLSVRQKLTRVSLVKFSSVTSLSARFEKKDK